MRSFEEEIGFDHKRFKRVFNVLFAIVSVIILFVIALTFYTLFNPEVIGEFAGEIIKGFKSTSHD